MRSFREKAVYEIKDWILWISLSVIIATAVGSLSSVLLDTGTPFMAVMSSSMLHDSSVSRNFYLWMENRGFSSEELESFPFPHGFSKGDVVVVVGKDDYEVGDVIIYNVPVQETPIVHRIIGKNGTDYRTKGDRNPVEDPWTAEADEIEGEVVLVLPYIGFIKVLPMEALAWVLGK